VGREEAAELASGESGDSLASLATQSCGGGAAGAWGLRFEPDFSNVESRRDTPVRPPTFSAFRTAKQQFSRG